MHVARSFDARVGWRFGDGGHIPGGGQFCGAARAEGLEPPNAGFGDRCLGRLATPACIVLLSSYPAGTKRGTHRAGFWRAVGSSKIRDDSYRHMRATCRRWLRGNQALIPVFNARVSAPSA